MKFILLSISLVIMTGCFNSNTPKEKSVALKEKGESNNNIPKTNQVSSNNTPKTNQVSSNNIPKINQKSEIVSQKTTTENIRTYTREELLQRSRKTTSKPIPSNCKSYPLYPYPQPTSSIIYTDEEDESSIEESIETIPTAVPIIYAEEEPDCTTTSAPIYTSTYTEKDFVSADVTPIENNNIEQSELKNYIDKYLEQLQTLNTDGIVSMTYPRFFKPINENLFRKYINTILNSSQISVDSFKTKLIYLGDVYPYDEGEFAQVIYQSDITLNFLNPDLYNDELSLRVLNNVLVSKYGSENIKINPTQRTINIKKEEKLLAIKERNEEWKFLGDNPAYRRYYPSVLPASILSQL